VPMLFFISVSSAERPRNRTRTCSRSAVEALEETAEIASDFNRSMRSLTDIVGDYGSTREYAS
jgi:hypothetical protein